MENLTETPKRFNQEIKLEQPFDVIEKVLCGNGTYEFFGLPMNQVPKALNAINHLLNIVKPEKIIEFGTGSGGLSVLLSLYASLKGVHFVTYDAGLHNQNVMRHLKDPTSFRWALLDKDDVKEEIKHMILQAKGPVILFCDALKSVEFDYYSDFCKAGDFLLVHDYAYEMNGEQFKKIAQKHNWTAPQEQCYENIKAACERNSIIPFMHDDFEDVLWFCGVKTINRK
jgi:cephalosporin hydroxylase